ncbi:family 16 glycosylhydrolase [Actinopolymorpha pittospori]
MRPIRRRDIIKGLGVGGLGVGLGTGALGSTSWAATTGASTSATSAARAVDPLPVSDPTNTGGWTLNPVFSDEFDGDELDLRKWYNFHTYWEGRSPSYFEPTNVTVGDGHAVIPFRNVNEVLNPSFEEGLTSSWDISASGARSVADGNFSPRVLRLDAGAWARQTIGTLRPRTRYRLTAYARVANGGTGVLRLADYGGRVREVALRSQNFGVVELTFPTGPDARSATVSVENTASTGRLDVTMVAIVDVRREDPPVGSYFSTGVIQSRSEAHYGFYEVRVRVADSSSTSSFWFQGSESEIDVVEAIGASTLDPSMGTKMPMNLHYFPGGWQNDQAFPVTYDTGVRLADDFHVFGLDWQADAIRFYFDGRLVRTQENLHWHEPEYLFLDSEAFLWYGFASPSQLPSQFQIDYVRAWLKSS